MISILKNLLYIFQLSEYDSVYFSNWVSFHPNPSQWLNLEKKGKLKWTYKARLIFSIALILQFAAIFNKKIVPKTLILAQKLLMPLERIWIIFLAKKARRKLTKYKNLKIVGIAGSFGKTTAKEYISHILSQKLKVVKTPENINTILGVVNFVLKTDFSDIDVFVAEIGAYQRGDVKRLCDILKPDIGVLTGIGNEHLERFGSFKNIIDTEFEIILSLNQKAVAIIPENQQSKIKIQKDKLKLKIFGFNNYKDGFYARNFLWGIGEVLIDIYKGKEFYFQAKIPIIAEHQLNLIFAALTVAEQFNLNKVEMKLGLESLPDIPRRLSFTQTSQNIWIIDDSYNITIEGAKAALKALDRLSKVNNRRRVVLSAGIPETGAFKKKIHHHLGKLYFKYSDLLLLLENSTSSFIIEGIISAQASSQKNYQTTSDFQNSSLVSNNLKIFKSAKEAQEALPNILKPNDIILIQAFDWPDHYY